MCEKAIDALRGLAIVELEQPAKAFTTDDPA
jgi:hypothetical protein